MHKLVVSGELVPVMTRFPLPPAEIYVIRPPGQNSARKIRVLTEMLIELCERTPYFTESEAV